MDCHSIFGIDKNNLEKIEYNKFIKLITDKKTIQNANNFMKLIGQHNHNKCGRLFISLFLIKYFPEETFEFDSEIKKNLIDISDKLIKYYYNSNLIEFTNNINTYILYFNEWKLEENIKLRELLNNTKKNINDSKKYIINNKDKLNNLDNIIIKHYNKQVNNIDNKIKFLEKC